LEGLWEQLSLSPYCEQDQAYLDYRYLLASPGREKQTKRKGLECLWRWLVPALLTKKSFLSTRFESPLLPLECIILDLDLEQCVLPEPLLL